MFRFFPFLIVDDTHCREEKRNMKQHKPALHVSAALNAKKNVFFRVLLRVIMSLDISLLMVMIIF